MQSIPLILTSLYPRRAAVADANAPDMSAAVSSGPDGPSQVRAPEEGIGDVIAAGTREHLGKLRKTIDALAIPHQQKKALLGRLGQCGDRFNALEAAVTKTLQLERGTAQGWGKQKDRDKTMSSSVVSENIRVASYCCEIAQDLDGLHADIKPHLTKRNVARTIGLAIGALLGLAAAATLAVLLWPVAAAGAVVGASFLLTGACAAAAGAAAGGIASAALCAKELACQPAAYRNFPKTRPDLHRLIQDIDRSLMQWLSQNTGMVQPLDMGALNEIFSNPVDAQAFCERVHASALSDTVKSLVPVPAGSEVSVEPNIPVQLPQAAGDAGAGVGEKNESEAVPTRQEIIELLAQVMGYLADSASESGSDTSQIRDRPPSVASGPAGPSQTTDRAAMRASLSRHSLTSEASAITMVMEDDANAPDLGFESNALFANAPAQGDAVVPAPEASSHLDDSGFADSDFQSDAQATLIRGREARDDRKGVDGAPAARLSQVWRDAVLDWQLTMAQVPLGPLDPADHIEEQHMEVPPIDLTNPVAVEGAWRQCVEVVESRLEFAETCLQILPIDNAWYPREPKSIDDVVIDRLARHQMLELLWGETSAVATLGSTRPGAFVAPDTLLAFTSILRAERKNAFRDMVHAIQQYLDPADSIPFDRLPAERQGSARGRWEQLLVRANRLSDDLQKSWEAFRYPAGQYAQVKNTALGMLGNDVGKAMTRFEIEAKARIKQKGLTSMV